MPLVQVTLNLRPIGDQQIASFSAAQKLAVPGGTVLALIRVETNNCRWKDTGAAPTAGAGYPLNVGDELAYDGNGWANLTFIPQTGSATLNAVYYGMDSDGTPTR